MAIPSLPTGPDDRTPAEPREATKAADGATTADPSAGRAAATDSGAGGPATADSGAGGAATATKAVGDAGTSSVGDAAKATAGVGSAATAGASSVATVDTGQPATASKPDEPAADATTKGKDPDSLVALLGGRRAGIDATVPPLAFVVAWLLFNATVPDQAVAWAGGIAVAVGLLLAAYRFQRGDRPRAVLLGLLGVTVAALIALYTGRAADFFLLQLATNAASALAWAISIAVRWPFLGLIVGTLLGQRTRWRRDPDLRRAYSLASSVWIVQYVVRVIVFGVLWYADAVVALGIARVALSWPLVGLCVLVSAWVVKRTLPADHPGLRRPRVPASAK